MIQFATKLLSKCTNEKQTKPNALARRLRCEERLARMFLGSGTEARTPIIDFENHESL
jgi:hypothetical protein